MAFFALSKLYDVPKVSLQKVNKDNISTPLEMLNFFKDIINGVILFYISSSDVERHTTYEVRRKVFKISHLSGSRSHHYFIPLLSLVQMETCHLSGNSLYSLLNLSMDDNIQLAINSIP